MKFKYDLIKFFLLDIVVILFIGLLIPYVIFDELTILFQVIFATVSIVVVGFYFYRLICQFLIKIIRVYDAKFYPESHLNLSYLYEKLQLIMKKSVDNEKRLNRANKTLRLVMDINNLFLKNYDDKRIYDFILEKAIEAVDSVTKGSIMLLNEEDDLEFMSILGFSEDFRKITIPKEKSFLYVLTNGKMDKSVIVNNVMDFNREYMIPDDFEEFYKKFPQEYQKVISVPIWLEEKFIGIINIDSSDPEAFDEEDLAIMDLFASQVELAIRNKELIDEILYLSRFDKLTETVNRSQFEAILIERVKSDNSFAFVLMDIDDLKKVNDQYGHREGDRLLKIFSETVRKNIRNTDSFGRIGGDEFTLLLPGMNTIEINRVFYRLMDQFKSIEEKESLPYEINFSYGITMYPDETINPEELYLKSDEKMYTMKRKAKEARKNSKKV